jgi:photosystem II stability/assembly factor-like uncharacterized protein
MSWRLVAALLVAVAAAVPAQAGPAPARWVTHGPWGGTVSALELDPARPARLLAGTHGAGVFVSTDAGRSWRHSSAGLPADTLVLALELAPSLPSTVYLEAYAGQRIFVSTNGGRAWAPLPYPPGSPGVNDLDADPARPQTVYLATHDGIVRWEGGSWAAVAAGVVRAPSRLAVAPSNANVLYADSEGAILRSTDRGATWARMSQGLEAFDVFEVDPRDPSTLYISTNDALLRSTDGGAHFAPLGSGWEWGRHVDALAVSGRSLSVGTWWTGVWRSGDGGRTWRRVARLPRERVRDIELGADGVLWAGVEHRGVVRIDGTGWRERTRGVAGAEVRTLVAAPAARATAYAGTTGGGVLRTTNGGRSWERRGLLGRKVVALAIDRAVPRVLYAATDRGLFRTADGGRSWRHVAGVPASVVSVAVAPSDHSTVYAGTFERGFYRSRDGGRTFRRTRTKVWQATLSIAVHPHDARTLWAGTRYDGITVSHDGGDTWTPGRGVPTHADPFAIVFDPRRLRTMYAALDAGGVYRTVDGGASWARVSASTPLQTALGLAVDRRGVVYAGGYDPNGHGGVFRTADGGVRWTDVTGTLTTTWIASLALTPSGVLLAGTTAYGRESGGRVFALPVGGR